MERIQYVLVILFGMFLSLLKAQDNLASCWFGAPSISEASVTQDIQVISTRISETRKNWSLQATVSWNRPSDFIPASDVYVISLRRIEGAEMPQEDFCQISENERTVESETVTFTNLSFGFVYEFKLYTYSKDTLRKSLTPTTMAFQTPDCYQATGDPYYCSTVDVQYSGAPLDPLLESICLNDTSVTVDISWLPPIQVNGNLLFFELKVTSATEESIGHNEQLDVSSEPPGDFPNAFGPPMSGKQVLVYLPEDYIEGEKISTQLSSLEENEYYYVTITPFVAINGSDEEDSVTSLGLYPGIEVEMSFFTDSDATNTTSEIPVCGDPFDEDTTMKPSSALANNITVDNTPTTAPATQKKTTQLTPNVTTNNKKETTKMSSRRPGKTKETPKTFDRKGKGIISEKEDPVTPIGILIVVMATLVVTILVITTLVVGVHYMRGIAPESPSKLGGTMNGSKRSNGIPVEETGTPLKEHV